MQLSSQQKMIARSKLQNAFDQPVMLQGFTLLKKTQTQNTKTNPTTAYSNCSLWSEGEKGLRRKEKEEESKLNQSTIKWLTGPAAVPQWKILLLLDLQTLYSWKPTYLIPINTFSQSQYTNQINDSFSLPQAERTLWQ